MPFTQSSKDIPKFEEIIEYHDRAIQIIDEMKKKEETSIQVNIRGRSIFVCCTIHDFTFVFLTEFFSGVSHVFTNSLFIK